MPDVTITPEIMDLMKRREEARAKANGLAQRNSAGLTLEAAFQLSVDFELAQREFRKIDDQYYDAVRKAADQVQGS